MAIVIVMWFFLMVPWVGLQCVSVVFPENTHFPFLRCILDLCFELSQEKKIIFVLSKNWCFSVIKSQYIT